MTYEPKKIEPKWQQFWLKNQVFRAEIDLTKPKYYALDMFPYPSGDGLHVGHPEGYTATDILSRYKRMCAALALDNEEHTIDGYRTFTDIFQVVGRKSMHDVGEEIH